MSPFYCEECNNSGEIECWCGGDLCVCMNHGSKPCPACGGIAPADDDPGTVEAEECE